MMIPRYIAAFLCLIGFTAGFAFGLFAMEQEDHILRQEQATRVEKVCAPFGGWQIVYVDREDVERVVCNGGVLLTLDKVRPD